ncbi:MAG: hypothetical protein RIT81_47150 [Deltaproteobacteria bacterium]
MTDREQNPIADLLAELADVDDPRFERLAAGALTEGERRALEVEAEKDPRIAKRLALYEPLDDLESSRIRPDFSRAEKANVSRLRVAWRGPLVAVAAAASVVFAVGQSMMPRLSIARLEGPSSVVEAAELVRITGDVEGVEGHEPRFVVWVRGVGEAKRIEAPVRLDGTRLELTRPAAILTGGLYGRVEVLVGVSKSDACERVDDSALTPGRHKGCAIHATKIQLRPPEYAMRLRVKDRRRSGETRSAATPTIRVPVGSTVQVSVQPKTQISPRGGLVSWLALVRADRLTMLGTVEGDGIQEATYDLATAELSAKPNEQVTLVLATGPSDAAWSDAREAIQRSEGLGPLWRVTRRRVIFIAAPDD